MATDTQSNPLKEQLDQTEIGRFIGAHLPGVIAAVVVAVLGVIGFGVFQHMEGEKTQEMANKVYAFESTHFEKLKNKKMTDAEYLQSFKNFSAEVKGFEGFATLAIRSSDLFAERDEHQTSLELLAASSDALTNPYLKLLVGLRKAVALEELGRVPEAKNELLSVLDLKLGVLEDKIYLDLGRLYQAEGDQNSAKSQYQYILDNFPQSTYVKLAKIELQRLN